MDTNMNKLICSLKSNLPNEIDFALKVSTLLVNSDNFVWSTHYPLVDAICSSVQVLTCVCKDNSINSTCDCYPRFWHKLLVGQQFDNPYLQAATLPPDTEKSYNRFSTLNDHELEDHTKIYRRVKAIADLIKEFSMTADTECEEPISTTTTTKKLPKASISLLKFVSLLLFCHDKQFNLIGLDILSNIASKLSKVEESPELIRMFQELCVESICVPDGDVYIMTRSIEAISKIISSSSPSVYSRVVSLIVENDVLARLEQLLTSRSDVTLFFATTECFYRISRHQPHLIAARSSQHLLKTLVNLLNFEDRKFFTPSALSRVELISPYEMDDMCTLDEFTKPSMVSSSTSTTMTPKANPTPALRQTPVTASKPNSMPVPKPIPVSKQNSIPVVNSNSVPVLNNQVSKPAPTLSNGISPQQPPQSVPPVQITHPTVQPAQAPQTVQTNQVSHTLASQVPTKEYVCEWNNCKLRFPTTNGVYTHVFEVHIESLAQDQLSSCQWTSPNGTGPGCLTKRPKYSLLTHLNDFHCNASALEMALRKSDHVKPPEHPGYGPNAALLAIKRHANLERNGVKLPDNSPISVSVRMTAALILRNLASESNEMKQALGHYEPILSEICMTNGRDESKIVAECLSLISSR